MLITVLWCCMWGRGWEGAVEPASCFPFQVVLMWSAACPHNWCIFYLFYFLIFTQRYVYWFEGETEREMWKKNINKFLPIHTLIRYQTCNLGVCPDRDSNLFSWQNDTPTSWATWPGKNKTFRRFTEISVSVTLSFLCNLCTPSTLPTQTSPEENERAYKHLKLKRKRW